MAQQPQKDKQGRLICPQCQRAKNRLVTVRQVNAVWRSGDYVEESVLYQEMCPHCQTVLCEEFHLE